MGVLIYGTNSHYDFDDRTLAHLKTAVGNKLRRQESFYLEWTKEPGDGGGRVSLWIANSVPLQFQFAQAEPRINHDWVAALLDTSYTPSGMILVPEPTGPETGQDERK